LIIYSFNHRNSVEQRIHEAIRTRNKIFLVFSPFYLCFIVPIEGIFFVAKLLNFGFINGKGNEWINQDFNKSSILVLVHLF